MSNEPDSLADFERRIRQIRENPDCDGTVLGTDGFMDQQDRAMAAVRHLWAERFLNIPFTSRALRDFLASQGITPLQANRMTVEDIETLLRKPADTDATATDHGARNGPPEEDYAATVSTNSKRSTVKGEGREKCVAALTQHHQYQDGSCLNLEPINSNELARKADVAKSTASEFFKREFKGHTAYKRLCKNSSALATSLKSLNEGFAPWELYGSDPDKHTSDDEDE